MASSADDDPEQLLSSALRAQAGDPAQSPQVPHEAGSGHGSTAAPQPSGKAPLPVLTALLISAAAGLLAGALAAVVTLI